MGAIDITTSQVRIEGVHPCYAWSELLEGCGVTQKELAEASGVSQKHLNRILREHSLPSARTVAKMARGLEDLRPSGDGDGGEKLARRMWQIQTRYMLHQALTEVEAE